jgi:hypothetical protein
MRDFPGDNEAIVDDRIDFIETTNASSESHVIDTTNAPSRPASASSRAISPKIDPLGIRQSKINMMNKVKDELQVDEFSMQPGSSERGSGLRNDVHNAILLAAKKFSTISHEIIVEAVVEDDHNFRDLDINTVGGGFNVSNIINDTSCLILTENSMGKSDKIVSSKLPNPQVSFPDWVISRKMLDTVIQSILFLFYKLHSMLNLVNQKKEERTLSIGVVRRVVIELGMIDKRRTSGASCSAFHAHDLDIILKKIGLKHITLNCFTFLLVQCAMKKFSPAKPSINWILDKLIEMIQDYVKCRFLRPSITMFPASSHASGKNKKKNIPSAPENGSSSNDTSISSSFIDKALSDHFENKIVLSLNSLELKNIEIILRREYKALQGIYECYLIESPRNKAQENILSKSHFSSILSVSSFLPPPTFTLSSAAQFAKDFNISPQLISLSQLRDIFNESLVSNFSLFEKNSSENATENTLNDDQFVKSDINMAINKLSDDQIEKELSPSKEMYEKLHDSFDAVLKLPQFLKFLVIIAMRCNWHSNITVNDKILLFPF